MSSPNIFADDWRACLHAHYLHVLHERDTSNEASLRLVLMQVGFDVNALDDVRTAEMQLEAPEAAFEAVEPQPVEQVVEMTAEEGISEEVIPEVVDEVTSEPDVSMTAEAPADDEEPPPAPPRDKPKPSQLSLF